MDVCCFLKSIWGGHCFLLSERKQNTQLLRIFIVSIHYVMVLVNYYTFHLNKDLSFKLFSQQAPEQRTWECSVHCCAQGTGTLPRASGINRNSLWDFILFRISLLIAFA